MASVSIALSLPALSDWFVDASANCAAGTGSAATPFCTIAEAIAEASSGDTIRIAPGQYDENLTLEKDLSLIGTDGRDVTIVDGGGVASVVTLTSGTTSQISGLTLTNGWNYGVGAGIYVQPSASLVLRRSSVSGNVNANSLFGAGGALFNSSGSTVSIFDSELNDNFSGAKAAWGGAISNNGTMSIAGTVIARNYISGESEAGAGVLNSGQLSMVNCTVTRNRGFYGYGGAVENIGGSVTIDSSIVYGNFVFAIAGAATVTHSDIQGGWAGAGNIAADPLFSNTVGGSYTLSAGSPCIDAGDPAAAPGGLDPLGFPRLLDGDLDRVMRVDMGAFEFDNVTLDVTGDPTPGGSLVVSTAGTSGLTVWLGIGRPGGEAFLAPWGTLAIDLTSPTRVFGFGVVPESRSYTIPASIVGPMDFALQALAFSTGGAPAAGNFSNPVFVTVR